MVRAALAALVLVLAGPQARFDPQHDSLAQSTPQPIYSADPADAWNQAFFLLFTRTIHSRVMADGAVPLGSGDERLKVSDRRVTRIEGGDRAIDPLYPTWVWMGSASFDFEPGAPWRILDEPRISQVRRALEGIARTAPSRTPLARALMQADLWSVHDTLYALAHARSARSIGDRIERARTLLPVVVSVMRALALSREQIAGLPDNYRAAVGGLGLPNVFARDSGWLEIRWFPNRSHDGSASCRRASRVFVKPSRPPSDVAAFLNRFRDGQGDNLGALDSVALVTQLLLVADDGTVVPSPLTFEVQVRGAAARTRNGEIPQYELSRRRMLASPSTGGFESVAANAPAYLPMAGNDLAFATPPRLDGEPVIAPLAARCQTCHGGTGVGHLMTFSMTTVPGRATPPVERLISADNLHARSVALRKSGQEDFAALRRLWR